MNETREGAGETVTTWANGFGVWHARVDFPYPGYGPAYLDKAHSRIRAKARQAIRRELNARGELGTGYAVRLQVVGNSLDSMNVMRSITYAERTD